MIAAPVPVSPPAEPAGHTSTATERGAERLRALHEAALELAAPVPAEPAAIAALLSRIAERAVADVDGYDGRLVLAEDPAWGDLVPGSRPADGYILLDHTGRLSRTPQRVEGATLHVLATGETVCVDDTLAETPFGRYPQLAEAGIRSFVLVPLRASGRILGVLGVSFRVPGPLPPPDREALHLFAAHAAAALERVRVRYSEQAAERRFRALIERSAEAIALVTTGGTILYASPATTTLLGYPLEDFVRRNAFDLLHPDDRGPTLRYFREVLKEAGRSRTTEYRARHYDGSWRWMEGTATNLLDEPSVQAIVVNYHRIDERKRLVTEQALKRALQRQVRELKQARQQISAAEDRMRREIAELLHSRVQNRLLVAWHRLGQCEALMDSDPERVKGLLRDVRDEIDRVREQEIRHATHLLHPSIINVGLVPAVRSLLGRFEPFFHTTLRIAPLVSKLDSPLDNQIPEPVRLSAYRILEEGLNNVHRHASARSVAVSLRITVSGTSGRGARGAQGARGRASRASRANTDGRQRQQRRQLVMTIVDDGCGFDPAAISPGLGLCSIAGRVEQCGGTWRISSAAGCGTTLAVSLPLAAPAD